MSLVSIIIPTYNESKNLPLLVEEIFSVLKGSEHDVELIIVDDNSPDGTGDVAEDLSKKFPIKVIHRQGKSGLGSAVREGFKHSNRPILGVMDADLSHDPAIIRPMLDSLQTHDITIGSRFEEKSKVESWQWRRKALSYAGVFFARLLTRVRDPLSGYFFFKRSVIDGVRLKTVGYKILLEILIKGTYANVMEVPFMFRMRKYSASKLNTKEYILFLSQLSKYGCLRMWNFLLKQKKLIALFTGAILIVLYASVTQSIWLDEGLNIQFARESVRETIERSQGSDLHPPLYYVFQHVMGKIFGTHLLMYRLWSLVFFVVSGVVLYRYLKKTNGNTTKNLLYLSFFLYSPFALFYATEARSYSFIILISFVQFFAFSRMLEKGVFKKREKVLYATSSIIGVYTSYLFIFLLAAQFLYLIITERKKFTQMLVLWLVIGIVYLPWLITTVFARMGETPGHFLAIPWWQIPVIIFVGFAGGRVTITDLNYIHNYWPTIVIGLAYLLNSIGLAYWWKNRKNGDPVHMHAFMLGLITIVLCLILSATKVSIFDPRYYTQLFPLFVLMMIGGNRYLHEKKPIWAKKITIFFFAGNILILGLYLFNPWYAREPWKIVVPELEAELQEGDAVLFIGYRQPPPTYTEYQKKNIEIISTQKELTEEGATFQAMKTHIMTEIANNQRVWYSQFLEWQKDPDGEIRSSLEEYFEYKKTIGFFKVKFDLYERR